MGLELQGAKTNGKLVVGVCYRPPNLKDEEEADLLLLIEMVERQGNVIMGGLQLPTY